MLHKWCWSFSISIIYYEYVPRWHNLHYLYQQTCCSLVYILNYILKIYGWDIDEHFDLCGHNVDTNQDSIWFHQVDGIDVSYDAVIAGHLVNMSVVLVDTIQASFSFPQIIPKNTHMYTLYTNFSFYITFTMFHYIGQW